MKANLFYALVHVFAFGVTLFEPRAGCADDSMRIQELLAASGSGGGVMTIPPGDYQLDGAKPLVLSSNTTIMAYGARFHLPTTLPDKAKLVVFAGQDVSNFAWHGGEFLGHVFDPDARENSWEPNATVKGIEVTTTRSGGTHDLHFRDVKANGLAGAVIGVHGLATKGSESEVAGWAEHQTAKPGQFPELYFTLYEPNASYGPVIVRDNIFILGNSAPKEVVTLAANGRNIQFTGNVFQTKPAQIVVDPTCTLTQIENNAGAETITKPVDFNHGRR